MAAKMLSGLLAASKPALATFAHYAKVELIPPKPSEFGAVKNGLVSVVQSAKSGAWKNLSMKEAWLNTLVFVEITMWFYVGECIGKRNIIGYDV